MIASILERCVADLALPVLPTPLVAQYPGSSGFIPNTTPRTASVTVNAGDTLVILAMAEDTLTVWATPTDNGPSLTYSSKVTSTGANRGKVQIWTAQAASSGSWTLSLNATTSPDTWGMTVLRFSGIDSVGPNVGAANNTTAQMDAALTTTANNSIIVAAAADWQALDAKARYWASINGVTPNFANMYEQVYAYNSGNFTAYAAFWPDAGTAGAKTPSATRYTTGGWSMASIELVKSVGGGVTEFEGWGVPI